MLDLKAASVDRELSCHLTEDGTASERISGAVSPIMTSLAGSRGSLDTVSEASRLWSALSGPGYICALNLLISSHPPSVFTCV